MRHVPRKLRSATVAFLALAVAPCATTAGFDAASVAASADDVVITRNGAVRGVVTSEMRSFLGIPYAAAPVGELRWRPPQPHPRWTETRDATHFGDHCAQPPSPFGQAGTVEDCLYLNVYTPAQASQPDETRHSYPVMVWIHPGGGFAGESDDWNPSPLVQQGIVAVTFNYRLGALGFLAHPALTAESPDHASGNYGLMDQQAALRWVRRDIARFGGDPNNVTIFGQSAGGYATRAQLASPTAAGLFHKAIIQTGAWAFRPPQERTPGFPARVTDAPLAVAEASGSTFATAVGCAHQTAACLRAVPVDAVIANAASVDVTVDGKVLTESISSAFTQGTFNKVPVMEGVAHDEWRMFVAFDELVNGPLTADQYPTAVSATLDASPADVSSIVAQYPVGDSASPGVALGAVGTDAALACPTRRDVQQLSQHVPTFMYEFNDPKAPPPAFLPPVSFPYGAFHGAELQYLFSTSSSSLLDADQQQLSQTMVRYWANFARTGRPSSPGTPPWPRYSTATGRFQALTTPRPTTTSGFAADHKCGFWATLEG